MRSLRLQSSLALLFVSLLAACVTRSASSPEQAAIDAVQHKIEGLQVDIDSIQILQSKSLDNRVLFLMFYKDLDETGKELRCNTAVVIEHVSMGWDSEQWKGGCRGAVDLPTPISITTGWLDGSDEPGIRFVYGVVFDKNVSSVLVDWGNGSVETLSVNKQSYLGAILGPDVSPREVRALDGDGGVLYSTITGIIIPPRK